jgi:hypothetical protein
MQRLVEKHLICLPQSSAGIREPRRNQNAQASRSESTHRCRDFDREVMACMGMKSHYSEGLGSCERIKSMK